MNIWSAGGGERLNAEERTNSENKYSESGYNCYLYLCIIIIHYCQRSRMTVNGGAYHWTVSYQSSIVSVGKSQLLNVDQSHFIGMRSQEFLLSGVNRCNAPVLIGFNHSLIFIEKSGWMGMNVKWAYPLWIWTFLFDRGKDIILSAILIPAMTHPIKYRIRVFKVLEYSPKTGASIRIVENAAPCFPRPSLYRLSIRIFQKSVKITSISVSSSTSSEIHTYM